jgi:undecaprenyl-diphosphatase
LASHPRALIRPAPIRLVLCGLALASIWTSMLVFGTGRLDRAILEGLYAGGNAVLVQSALIVTRFGDPDLVTLVAGLGALLLIFRRDLRGAALLLAISLSGRLFVNLLKLWIARPRPDADLHLVGTRTDSFPSGHAASAILVWVTLALLIPRTARGRRPALLAAALLAIAVGLSRPMLGVHYPSDVIAGWSVGLFWIGLLMRLSGYRFADAARLS